MSWIKVTVDEEEPCCVQCACQNKCEGENCGPDYGWYRYVRFEEYEEEEEKQ